MKLRCRDCGVEMEIRNPVSGSRGECPKCRAPVRIARGAKEYRILSQKMLCGGLDVFDAESAERVLNQYACEGWRVVGLSEMAKATFGYPQAIYPAVLILERDLPEPQQQVALQDEP